MNDRDDARFVLPAQLEISRILPATPEVVWKYLVDPEYRQLWFCAGETGSGPGEPFVMDFDHTRIASSQAPEGCGDPVVVVGRIITFDPPRLLSYDWPGEDEASTTRVTIRLEPVGEETRLLLVHQRLGSLDFKRGAAAGWHAHLDLLLDVLASHERRDFWQHYLALQARYQ